MDDFFQSLRENCMDDLLLLLFSVSVLALDCSYKKGNLTRERERLKQCYNVMLCIK